ncbi:acid sphingomyelinase-like phosphodiesterase 3b [Ditylenchus destructor]|nr:acid sphingomyelinase-like phosphodiesterase 3b [Ditylenchus destructor]
MESPNYLSTYFIVTFLLLTHKSNAESSVKQILQLTDFHYDPDYSTQGNAGKMCHKGNSTDSKSDLGEYGDYKCDAPLSLVEHAIRGAKSILPNPELILWTGDNVPHVDGYNEDYTINVIGKTTNLLRDIFPGVLVLPVFGNHDYAPANDFPDFQTNIYYRTYQLWKPWIGEQAESDPAGQFQFMENTLEDAKTKGHNVHVIAHIPPGIFERIVNFQWFRPEYNKRFLEITVKYAQTIKWMVFGHHHSDSFHLVKDNVGNAVQLMLMSPGVTPWYSDWSLDSRNPAFRVFDYEPTTWRYNDIRTYWINLDELNKNKSTTWSLEYSMKSAYKLDEISPQSFAKIVGTFKSDNKEDSSYFADYMRYNTVQWNTSVPTGANRVAHICALEYPDYDEYSKCIVS